MTKEVRIAIVAGETSGDLLASLLIVALRACLPQAGSFPAWAVPSIDTKSAAPLISRAGFMAWVKDFYKLEKVYTKEDPKE